MADWIDVGGDVHVTIKPSEYVDGRPGSVAVSYVVRDSETGEVLGEKEHTFKNEGDQEYTRLSAAQIQEIADDVRSAFNP